MCATTSRAPARPTSKRRGIRSNTPSSWKTARRACRGRRSPARRRASGRIFRISNGCEELLPPPLWGRVGGGGGGAPAGVEARARPLAPHPCPSPQGGGEIEKGRERHVA